ncbi:MAG TPA: hypothetical protein VFO46_02360 [Candidatus Sulfotelmatobacter sp.]|nr:hypothetical protein [Candidatus Sulfotelmatobacter sp.]
MTRRLFGAAAAVAAMWPQHDWITVAALGTNKAGRVYDEHSMEIIRRDVIPGTSVMQWGCSNPENLVATVIAARYVSGLFQVRVRWVLKPSERSWISLNCMAFMDDPQHPRLTNVINLEITSGGSTFAQATSV